MNSLIDLRAEFRLVAGERNGDRRQSTVIGSDEVGTRHDENGNERPEQEADQSALSNKREEASFGAWRSSRVAGAAPRKSQPAPATVPMICAATNPGASACATPEIVSVK